MQRAFRVGYASVHQSPDSHGGVLSTRHDTIPKATLPKHRILLVLAAAGVTMIAVLAAFFLRESQAGWRFSQVESAATGAGGEFRRVTFAGPAGSFEVSSAVLDADAVRASFVDLGPDRQTTLRQLRDEQQALVVVNGGYFDPQFRPVGLLRIDGRKLSALLDRPPLSACLIINDAGRPSVVEARDPTVATAPSAMQAGPFLIEPGGRLGIREEADTGAPAPAAERTVIATDGTRLCLIVTTPVTLRHLAECLVQHPAAFGLSSTDRALNLDGGPSTGSAFRTADRVLVREPRGRVRTFLVIQSK